MAVVVTPGQAPGSDSYRAKRSEALPKTSLFGSPLEIQNKENATSDIDPSAVHFPSAPQVKGPGQRFTLPDDIKNQLPAAGIFERSKRDYDVQKNLVNQQANDLKQKEEKVLFDRSAVNAELLSHREPGTARGFKFTESDLIGSKEINKLGLNVNQSYNRDKYGQKAPVHNYSLIGDVLRPGMDFPRRERTDVQMRNMGYGKGDLKGILAETPRWTRQNGSSSAKPLLTEKSLEVPPNIKHQFGTKECDRLLSDTEAVNKTVRKQKDLKDSLQRKSQPFEVPKFSREINPEYEMLGNSLRMNVVPGYTTDHKISTTKTAFNDQVHLFRYQDPDKWRYQKDELSKWREVRFLQELLAKGWNSLQDSAPKFQRNWDPAEQRQRTKTAPVSNTQKKVRSVQKPKTAPKKKTEEVDEKFEEIVFKTPPRTPSPEKVQIVNKNQRDNEFWDFYDKGGEK